MGLLLVLAGSKALACTKTVRWFDDAPYSFQAADGQVTGIEADIAREALRRAGCQARFVHMPWARALVELEAGRLDVLSGAFRSSERERFAWFSTTLPESPNVLYLGPAAARKYHPASLDDLLGTDFRLAVQIGVSYGEKFERLKANPQFRNNLVPVTHRRNAWKMMSLGRIDGLIADQASATVELRQLGLAGVFRASQVVVSTNAAGFALSKASNSAPFVDVFDKALRDMAADGQLREIYKRHLD